jgi:hypothetical protein
MGKYTIETLKPLNELYDREYRLNQADVDMANKFVELIESSRDEHRPQVGDMVQFTDKHGNFYKSAHIEESYDERLYICEHPYVPFVYDGHFKFHCSTSGGAWCYIPANINYVGQVEKTFCKFGHGGGRANGAVHFKATVNVWSYKEPEV